MFPYVVLGGFLPDGTTGYPENPDYANASAVVLTFLVNNFDAKSKDRSVQIELEKAKAWEETFISFMKNWTANSNNTKYMDVAYNSER